MFPFRRRQTHLFLHFRPRTLCDVGSSQQLRYPYAESQTGWNPMCDRGCVIGLVQAASLHRLTRLWPRYQLSAKRYMTLIPRRLMTLPLSQEIPSRLGVLESSLLIFLCFVQSSNSVRSGTSSVVQYLLQFSAFQQSRGCWCIS
jgi:hypothetical protein